MDVMIRRLVRPTVMAGFVVAVLAAGDAVAFGQERGNVGLPPGSSNPLAVLQSEIDALAQQLAALTNGGVASGGEPGLVVIRGTVAGNGSPLLGAGFTVTTNVNLPCGTNLYPEYHVIFDQAFSSTPSVVV